MDVKKKIIFEFMEHNFEIKSKTTGFSSPAENYVSKRLDPSAFLIKNQYSTYFLRASGSKFDIKDGDILVVDRSLMPLEDKIVVVEKNGKLEIDKYEFRNNTKIWGVVTYIIKEL